MRAVRLGATAAMVLCLHATVVSAQMAGGAGQSPFGGRAGGGSRASRSTASQTPRLPNAPPIPEVWPRLDPGAVFCRSQNDLVARASMTGDLPAGCQRVQQATAVTIVNRIPPGATQVRLTASGEVGWTDAWLPEKQPAK